MNTGFLALSNNIPILAEAIQQARIQNEQLIASGQKGVPVWKQLAGALFSWQTALSVAITLLTVYGSDIVKWIQNMTVGAKSIDSLKSAQESLNEAFKDNSVKKAVSDIQEMKTVLDMAKRGVIDKDRALKFYNNTLGKVIGNAKNLNEAEQLLVRNGEAYIKMTLYKAAAEKARDKQAEELLKEEEARMKSIKEFTNVLDAGGISFSFDSKDTWENKKSQQEQRDKYVKQQAIKRKNEAIKIAQESAKKQGDIVANFMKKQKQKQKS